jgi:hypothetical protein
LKKIKKWLIFVKNIKNMESAVFHLNSEELDMRFVESIKSFFKNRRIKVIITEMTEDDEQLTEAQVLKVIEQNRATPYNYDVPRLDFKKLATQFREDENFDIAEAIAAYKTDK